MAEVLKNATNTATTTAAATDSEAGQEAENGEVSEDGEIGSDPVSMDGGGDDDIGEQNGDANKAEESVPEPLPVTVPHGMIGPCKSDSCIDSFE